MSNNDNFYKILDEKTLGDVALKTFGRNPSSDFLQIRRFIKPGDKVLEIGTGTGRLCLQLLDLDIHYTGVEKQKPYPTTTKIKLQNKGIPKSKYKLLNKSFEDLSARNIFDVILFSWSVIGDFNKGAQKKMLAKAFSHLKTNGICIIDNPSENQSYNKARGYKPTLFYYKDWKYYFARMGFSHKAKIYKTKTGVERELITLKKP